MQIDALMDESGVGFGTSGARGLATAMTDRVCYGYTLAFLQHLRDSGQLQRGTDVVMGGDRRPSTPRILAACARAVLDWGARPRNAGEVPTPALAAFGIGRGIPSLMVTGSHIPDDRNGIKFNKPGGEILKGDEAGIRAQRVALPPGYFAADGAFRDPALGVLPPEDPGVLAAYVARYLGPFPPGALAGLHLGLYEHSSVAAAPFRQVLEGLGARVTPLGYSEVFVPVDTEAIRPEDLDQARAWAAGGDFTAIVSADGDGDRPLVSDERGEWLRGDIAGILCARFLGAQGVVTPVSSNTALERSGWFPRVDRTRIGSPYVIAGMERLLAEGVAPVVGYEANGGFLLGSEVVFPGGLLAALPTRDALLPALAVLSLAREKGGSVAALRDGLPSRHTHSDRIKDFPVALSRARLGGLSSGDPGQDRRALDALFARYFGPAAAIDATDGIRVTFESGEIAHLRPSGNAPELRAYTEADSLVRAQAMNRLCMEILAGWKAAG